MDGTVEMKGGKDFEMMDKTHKGIPCTHHPISHSIRCTYFFRPTNFRFRVSIVAPQKQEATYSSFFLIIISYSPLLSVSFAISHITYCAEDSSS